MSLTFGQAKNILAQYQGKGGKVPTADEIDNFVIKVLQYLLITGSPNCERSFTMNAVNGVFTAPYELETPLKVRVDGRVGTVGTKWFEFRSGSDSYDKSCYGSDMLYEDPNPYYTAFDGPNGGFQVGVTGTVTEDCDAHIIIAGNDASGREIFTNHKGAEIAGERLDIGKNIITWSNVSFDTIVSVVKTRTNGYTPLYWKTSDGKKGFLADYSPVDEAPNYRRFKLQIPNCPSPAKLTILGRLRLKSHYADNDRIPFDNLYAIEVAGQQINQQFTEKFQEAAQSDVFLQKLTGRESEYKKINNGQPLEFFYPLSGGTIKGIV